MRIEKETEILIRGALVEFFDNVKKNKWYGKEREAVSLFAFDNLIKKICPNSILFDPAQIGIEVRVPITSLNKKKEVCKDLVIWPNPNMNVWDLNKNPVNQPRTIIEWKVLPNNIKEKPLKNDLHDIAWIKEFSKNKRNFIGFLVTLDVTNHKYKLLYTKIYMGHEVESNLLK